MGLILLDLPTRKQFNRREYPDKHALTPPSRSLSGKDEDLVWMDRSSFPPFPRRIIAGPVYTHRRASAHVSHGTTQRPCYQRTRSLVQRAHSYARIEVLARAYTHTHIYTHVHAHNVKFNTSRWLTEKPCRRVTHEL